VNNINTQSVIKAGAVGAAINIVLGLLGLAPLLVEELAILTVPLLCCGALLIPVLSGALYGYFTPGRETTGQAALGGALAGVAAGLMYGVFNAIANAVFILTEGGNFGDALGASAGTIVGACCGAILFGALLGAVGGAIWMATQGNKA
jgi:hypothetical protein